MSNLPSGTVTFLFTDVEGSTRLAQAHPAAMKAALARHRAILQQAIESHDGYVFQIIGDAFCAAFVTAPDALKAALAAQRALHTEAWSETSPLRVRMGLHAGIAQVRSDDVKAGQYSGYITLARTQRIMSAGHGGQVLLTQAVHELVRDHLPEDITLRDLGEHRLKDLSRPEHLFQLAAPDLPFEFSPLKTLDRVPNNLPIQLTSFVGREHELTEVKRLLGAARLLTLTGSGGAGKSRLSLQVVADVLDNYKDGAWFIELAPLTDPVLIPQTVASALGLREEQGRPLIAILSDYLHAKTALIILDNCEHLIAGCAQFADTILHTAPNVKILASSREALGIDGEATYRVPSLAVPDPQHTLSLETLTQYDAVKLFIERAMAAQSAFQVTNANAPAVAQICFHLDGIPLALELAAARVRGMKVEQIAQRLDDRFRLLTGGSRTAMPRHQTLRAMIDWSHSLLSDQERILFRRLSVFAGSWSIEAAEAVCADDVGADPGVGPGADTRISPDDVLDLLLHLVDKSLVIVDEQSDETRYHMLETIRQYANEKLLETGESQQVKDRHLDFFVKLAEEAEPQMYKSKQATWLVRLGLELDNFRAALGWSMNGGQSELGLLLASDLWYSWLVGIHLSEGRKWLVALLAKTQSSDSTTTARSSANRAKALSRAGFLKSDDGDAKQARELAEEGLTLSRQYAKKHDLAFALITMGREISSSHGDLEQTRELLEEGLAYARDAGHIWYMAVAHFMLAELAVQQDDYERAEALYATCFSLCEKVGDKIGIADILTGQARIAQNRGDYARAIALYKQSLAKSQELGLTHRQAGVIRALGYTALEQGDYEQAAMFLEESHTASKDLGAKGDIAWSLRGLAMLAWRQGDYTLAVKLLEECLTLQKEVRDDQAIAYTEFVLGDVARAQGDNVRATALYRESLSHQAKEDKWGNVMTLQRFAAIVGIRGRPEKAARLFATAEAIQTAIGAVLPPVERADHERDIAAVRV